MSDGLNETPNQGAAMYEVIISQVRTGKIQRAYFPTRADAEKYVSKREEQIVLPKRAGSKPGSLRDYRMEICYREPPRPLTLPELMAAAA